MRAKIVPVVVAGVTAAVALALLLWSQAAKIRREGEAAGASAAATRVRLEGEIRRAEQRLAELRSRQAAPRAALVTTTAAPVTAVAQAKPPFVPEPANALSPEENANWKCCSFSRCGRPWF